MQKEDIRKGVATTSQEMRQLDEKYWSILRDLGQPPCSPALSSSHLNANITRGSLKAVIHNIPTVLFPFFFFFWIAAMLVLVHDPRQSCPPLCCVFSVALQSESQTTTPPGTPWDLIHNQYSSKRNDPHLQVGNVNDVLDGFVLMGAGGFRVDGKLNDGPMCCHNDPENDNVTDEERRVKLKAWYK